MTREGDKEEVLMMQGLWDYGNGFNDSFVARGWHLDVQTQSTNRCAGEKLCACSASGGSNLRL